MRRTLSMFLSVLMVLSCMTAIFAVAASGEELISGTYPIGNALGLNDDEITIIAGAIEGNETTTVVDRTAYTHDSDFVPGDVNENKEVDHLDYAMVKRHVLGANFELTPEQQIIADVNVSGKVEAVDYAMIKRYVLGTYPDFPKTIPVNEPGKTFDEYTVITVNAEGTVESVDAAAEGRDAVAIPEGGYVIAIPSKLISGDAAVYDISGIEKGTELKLDGVTVEEVAALTAPKALENASFSVVNAVEPEVGKYKILTFAGYASGDINLFLRLESGEKTLNDIGNKINNREATDYNAYKVLVADKDGFVTAIYTTTGRPDGVKGDVEVPEGGFAIGVNIYGDANNADYAAALAIFDTLKVGDYVELLNVDLEKDGTETVNEYSSFNVVSLDPVPEEASAINFAQHWNANICTIYTRLETGEKTVGEVTAVTTGKAQDCKWWNAIVVDAEGKVVKVIGMVDKTDEEIPEGGYILLAHGSSPALSVLAGIPQGSTVTLYNCDLAAFAKLTEGTALKGAAFTYTEPEAVRALSYQKTYTIAKGDGEATYWTHWDASVGSLADDGKILTDGRRGSVNGDSHDYVAVNDLSGEGAYVKIVVDLGDTYFVDKFNAYTVSNKGEGGWGISEANFVRVKVSTDGETFTEVGFNENKQTLFVGTGAEGQWNSYESAIQLDKAVSARYVEFDVYNNGSFCWIDEVEVWEGEDPGEDPAVEPFKITVNVKDNAILTDGQTGFDGDWGTVGNSKVLLVANSECKTAPMEVTVIHELDAVKSVKSIALDLYHCAGVMIGYPEGKAVVSVSEDGTTYTEVGSYDLAAAELELGKYGTVTNKFEFDAVNAKFVKVVLNVGKSTDVLGETPADDKIYWEFISIAEVSVEEGAKDSLLDDAIWEGTEAIKVTAENGRWQNAREDALLTYDLTLTDDGEYFYVKVLGNGTFATEISTFRFWIRSNSEATVYTHFYDVDIAEDGTVTNKAKYNKSTTSNSGDNIANSSMEYDARATDDGKTEIAFKVLLSEFNGAEGFAYYAALMKKGVDYSYYPAPEGTDTANMPYKVWDAEHEGWYGEKYDDHLDFSWVEGWTNVTGENSWEWQLDNVGKHKFDYAVQKDGENFKIAIKYYGDLYAAENVGAVNGKDTNGNATNLRVWFFDPNNTVNRKNFTGLVDVGYNGSKFFIDRVDEYNVTAKGKMTGEAIDFPGSFEAAVVKGGAEIALTIPASFISRDEGAQFILTLSTPLADGTNNTALFSHSINDEGKYKAAWNPWDSEHAIVFPAKEPEIALGTNLASGKTVTYEGTTVTTGTYIGDLTDGKGADWGSYDATWRSFNKGTGTATIDLGEVKENVGVVRVNIWPANKSGISKPDSVTFQVSEDGTNFTEAGAMDLSDPEYAKFSDQAFWVDTKLNEAYSARYVRVTVTTSGSFSFLAEVEVYDIIPADYIEPTHGYTYTTDSINLISYKLGKTLGDVMDKGHQWWDLAVVQWDVDKGAFVVKEVLVGDHDKDNFRTVEIPTYGFILGTHDTSMPEAAEFIKGLKAGDVVYVYNADINEITEKDVALENAFVSKQELFGREACKLDVYKIKTYQGYNTNDVTVFTSLATGEKTLKTISGKLRGDAGKDYHAYAVIVVDADGKVTEVLSGHADGDDKSDVEVPEGGFIIGFHSDAYIAELFENVFKTDEITLANVDLEAASNATATNNALTNAFFGVKQHAHIYGDDAVVDPTCVAAGYTHHVCTICGYDEKVGDEVPATGIHTYETEIHGSFVKHTCPVCGDWYFTDADESKDFIVDYKISHLNAYNWMGHETMVLTREGKTVKEIISNYSGSNWIAYVVKNNGTDYVFSEFYSGDVATVTVPTGGFVIVANANNGLYADGKNGGLLGYVAYPNFPLDAQWGVDATAQPHLLRHLLVMNPTASKNLALGKTYTTTDPNRDDAWDDDGKKLTDGLRELTATSPRCAAWKLGADVEIVIDLGEAINVDTFKVIAASQSGWGVSAPAKIEVALSTDGTNFTDCGVASTTVLLGTSGDWGQHELSVSLSAKQSARYVKIVVTHGGDHTWIHEVEVFNLL